MSSGGRAGKPKEEEQDGMSVHSPCKPPPSSASSLPKVSVSLSLFEIWIQVWNWHLVMVTGAITGWIGAEIVGSSWGLPSNEVTR